MPALLLSSSWSSWSLLPTCGPAVRLPHLFLLLHLPPPPLPVLQLLLPLLPLLPLPPPHLFLGRKEDDREEEEVAEEGEAEEEEADQEEEAE